MAISNTNLLQTKKPISLPLLAFITLFLMLLNRVNSSDSLSFTFDNFRPDQRDLILQGDAKISSGGDSLQLTKTDTSGKPVRGSVGRALYYTPLHLWDSSTNRLASFQTTFTFVLSSPTNNPGDGIAFFIAPPETTIPPGSSGGLLGLFSPDNALNNSLNQIVAVEFDTFVNNNWDPSHRHIGIDVNTIKSSATVRWQRENGSLATAQISYNSDTKKLSVVSSYPNTQANEDYTVSYDVDLKTELPEWVRVGFSGSTGGYVQNHNILSWTFNSNLQSSRAKKEDIYIKRYV
uniref:Agglutinin-2 n=1 Tax=Cladrastis kentukea TaxID=38412 RepID=LEC2_CLAKE|nr:RecName: Full=Agglutinin-2; AltName: Full=Agglutinin II; AltName: Full=ClAII; AltName: Full=LecClAII; Flags: Precursor [Cladrastis kentukea]AAC49137.1 lectin precursor [Cladrastis kentukea]